MSEDSYTVERTVRVDAPPERVYDEIADFARWQAWSPWEGLDPDMRRTYSEPSGGLDATYAWSGNRRAGAGSMRIVEASAPSKVRIDLSFLKPFKARNETVFVVAPDSDGSTVTWTMTGRRTLATRVMGVFTSMDSFIGKDFERGLTRLKGVVEARP